MHRTNPSTDLRALKPIRTQAPKGANHWNVLIIGQALQKDFGSMPAIFNIFSKFRLSFLVPSKKLVGREFVSCMHILKPYGFMWGFVLKENAYLVSSRVLLG